jgi:hypothetical protein
MPKLPLQSKDLLVPALALGTSLEEMRKYFSEELFMAEITGEQFRQSFNRWMVQDFLPRGMQIGNLSRGSHSNKYHEEGKSCQAERIGLAVGRAGRIDSSTLVIGSRHTSPNP